MAVDLAGGVPVGPTLDLRYRRIDASGNVAVETWNSVPWGGGDPVLRLQAVDPAGRQGLRSLAEDASPGADVARIALARHALKGLFSRMQVARTIVDQNCQHRWL